MKEFITINSEPIDFVSANSDAKTNLIKELNNSFNLWRSCDLIATLFSMMGILTSTINYEVNYPSSRATSSCDIDMKNIENYRIGTMILTLASVIFIICRYYYKDK